MCITYIISSALKSYVFGTLGPWCPMVPSIVSRVLCCHEVRLMGQKVDTTHCFDPGCMDELRRVILLSGAEIVVTSSWRQRLQLNMGKHQGIFQH